MSIYTRTLIWYSHNSESMMLMHEWRIDVDTYAARLPGQRTGGFGTNDEILDRLIEADHSRVFTCSF